MSNESVSRQRDPLDTAYLTIGAYQALKALKDKPYDNLTVADGECGLIGEMLGACDAALRDTWAQIDATAEGWTGGCWAYDIAEPLGMWWVNTYAATGLPPLRAAVDAKLAEMIEAEGR
ncbi:hypothetical protein [Stenotrophomonas muris]|uniref:hypothetical protein n=1 Tax=Stenotrophomonas muris TaxID=2963283 RepID=UPI0040559727